MISAGKKTELYNLAIDPQEQSNLAATEAEKLTELQDLLAQQRSRDQLQLPADLEETPN